MGTGHGIGQEDGGSSRRFGQIVDARDDPARDGVHVHDDLGARPGPMNAHPPGGMEEPPRRVPQELRPPHHAHAAPGVADRGEGEAHRAALGERGLVGLAQDVLGHCAALHEVHAPIAADVHGDVGAVNATAAPDLLVDDVIRAEAVDHPAQVEAIEGGSDAEVLAVGLEELPGDAPRCPAAALAPEAPELLGRRVALPRYGLERARRESLHRAGTGSGATRWG